MRFIFNVCIKDFTTQYYKQDLSFRLQMKLSIENEYDIGVSYEMQRV
jgi:hypothetical protein